MREEVELGMIMKEIVKEKVSTIGVVDTLKWSIDRSLLEVVKYLINNFNYTYEVLSECKDICHNSGEFGIRRFLEERLYEKRS